MLVGSVGDWVVMFFNVFKVVDGDELMLVNLGIFLLCIFIEVIWNDWDLVYCGLLVLIDVIISNLGVLGGVVVNVDGDLIGMIGKLIESSEINMWLNYVVLSDLLF